MLYTIGYSGWTIVALYDMVMAIDAALLDIRYRPASRYQPQWRGCTLERWFHDRYHRCQALGNRNYTRRDLPIVIDNYDTGQAYVARLLQEPRPLVLLCGCADLAHCHRLEVAERLGYDLDHAIIHFTPPTPEESRLLPNPPAAGLRTPEPWQEMRARVLARADNACEGSPYYPACRVANGSQLADGRLVVLTIAALDHQPEHCDPANLRAWCQRCHLTYAAAHHRHHGHHRLRRPTERRRAASVRSAAHATSPQP